MEEGEGEKSDQVGAARSFCMKSEPHISKFCDLLPEEETASDLHGTLL